MFCSFLNLDNDRQQQNWAFLESEKFFNETIYNIFRGANTDLIPKFNNPTPLSLSLARKKKSFKTKALHHVVIGCMNTLNLENEKNSMSLF